MSAGLDDEKLQRFFDGDLPAEEAAQLRAELDASDADRARLERLERTRQGFAEGFDAGAPPDADALFAAILAGSKQIEEEPTGAARLDPLRRVDLPGKHLRVVEGGARPGRPEGWKIAAPVILAIAAAFFVGFLFRGDGSPAPTAARPAPGVLLEEPPDLTVIEPPMGTEVEDVDFGSNAGTVFEVEGNAGEPIAVVWIVEEPGTP